MGVLMGWYGVKEDYCVDIVFMAAGLYCAVIRGLSQNLMLGTV